MTDFRNIALHQYQEIVNEIVHHIAKEGWKDLVVFCTHLGLKIDPDASGESTHRINTIQIAFLKRFAVMGS